VTLAQADHGGARVTEVARGSVAASAGLRAGDVVVEAAGAPVTSPADLRRVVDLQAPGTWLPLRVRRDGRERQLVARFGRPS
jgi:S1-C subfamily serine protease